MKGYLMSIGLEVWESFEEIYDVPKVIPTETRDRKKFCKHANVLNTLQAGVSKRVLAKPITYKSEKQLWDKLETLYAGYSKVKTTKLQSLKVQYECLRIKDNKTISEYFEKINSITNTTIGLGAEITDNGSEKFIKNTPYGI